MALSILRAEGHFPLWTEGADADQLLEIVGFWHVWADGYRWRGYFAAQDVGKGRWVIHFGNKRDLSPGFMLPAWREFLKIAQNHSVRLLAAYIPQEAVRIRRAAKLFHFRQFSDQLWVFPVQNHQKSIHQKARHQL